MPPDSVVSVTASLRQSRVLVLRGDRPDSLQRQFGTNLGRETIVLLQQLLDQRLGIPQPDPEELGGWRYPGPSSTGR